VPASVTRDPQVPALTAAEPYDLDGDTASPRTGQYGKWERVAALALNPRAVVVARPSSGLEHRHLVALDADEAPSSRRGRPAYKRESHDHSDNDKPNIP
jgi:hypothetical protein